MNGLIATEKLTQLNKRIEALDAAYKELWRDFDNRWMAVEIGRLSKELTEQRDEIVAKLRTVEL